MFKLITNFFGGGYIKMIAIVAIVVGIVAVVGGFWIYQAKLMSEKDAKLAALQSTISTLIIDNKTLSNSNASLMREKERRAFELKQIQQERDTVEKITKESLQRISELASKINDAEAKKAILKVRESKQSLVLLNSINNDLKCFIDNFNRVDGACISGQFIPTEVK